MAHTKKMAAAATASTKPELMPPPPYAAFAADGANHDATASRSKSRCRRSTAARGLVRLSVLVFCLVSILSTSSSTSRVVVTALPPQRQLQQQPVLRQRRGAAAAAAQVGGAVSVVVSPTVAAAVLINAGGGEFIDSTGAVWEADNLRAFYKDGGTRGTSGVSSVGIVGLTNQDNAPLYQSTRTWKRIKPGPYRYKIPIAAAAEYKVVLHFSENDPQRGKVGKRIFDVLIQDEMVAPNFDIVAAAGGPYTATTLTSTILVDAAAATNIGFVTIEFQAVQFNPCLSAIAIYQIVSPTTMPPPPPSPVDESKEAIVRINAGGGRFTDAMGAVWDADLLGAYFQFGGGTFGNSETSSANIVNTADDSLYQSFREFKRSKQGPYLYQIPVPAPGVYRVELHFAELDPLRAGIGKRIFDVLIQDKTVAEKFDIVAAAGGSHTAVTISTAAIVSGSSGTPALAIELKSVKSNPTISAIAIFATTGSLAPVFPTPAPIAPPSLDPLAELQAVALINAGGGSDFTDSRGFLWEKDSLNAYYSSSGTFGNSGRSSATIANTADDTLYQSSREFKRSKQGPYQYEIPVPTAGEYTVVLHFAETDLLRARVGDRIVNIWIEGVLTAESFDIVAAAGGDAFTAVTLSRTAEVTDGLVTIELKPVRFNPSIAGIGVYQQREATPAPAHQPTMVPTAFPSMKFSSGAPTFAIPTSVSSIPSTMPPQSQKPVMVPSTSLVPTRFVGDPNSTAAPSLHQQTVSPTTFQKVLINAGGTDYEDVEEHVWVGDANALKFKGGQTSSVLASIAGTLDLPLYQSERYGAFAYEIELPEANYEVILHFAELKEHGVGDRIFDISVEGALAFVGVDIVDLVGSPLTALTLETVVVVSDGFLSLAFTPVTGFPTISAIEIDLVGDHLAHAVAGGPYTAVDVYNTGFALVEVNAVQSHTHGPGLSITEWIWKEGGTTIQTGEITSLNLSVGEHVISLRVKDDGGNKSKETTTVTVLPAGHPVIDNLTPNSGEIVGGSNVTISGHGFNFTEAETIVHFGYYDLTGASKITIVNENTIVITSGVPPEAIAVPVSVSVSTPISVSNDVTFTYISGTQIDWIRGHLFEIYGPTTVVFGPDELLYIGTSDGTLVKLTLDDNLEAVVSSVSSSIWPGRLILGIAFDPIDTFDPMDTSKHPTVYVSHSKSFHGESKSSSGGSINGKISRVSGANLDFIDDVITGLPVSDHDHAVNGLEFGDNGELYIAIGGNTNGGVPGALSGTQLQKENVLSSAILIGHLSRSNFDGYITYSADDDGDQTGGFDVEVFASGIRNPFDLVLHSNGKIYCTDNGPNLKYGDMSSGCGEIGNAIPDIEQEDKLNLIEQGRYYGHPNRKRGQNDPRQCVWRSALESDDADYTAPLAELPASSNGIVEWKTDHFGGQLRGDMIVSKYKGGLYRVLLAPPDGLEVRKTFLLHNDGGLDVTQGPDGTLFIAKHKQGKVRYLKPLEAASPLLAVKSVFPRRGSVAGGSVLNVYGDNFDSSPGTPTVVVGGNDCVVLTFSKSKITCTLPEGSGTVDIKVFHGGYPWSNNSEASTFTAGYRFITGLPAP